MFTYSHTVSTTADPETVWALYADVARWREWDASLAEITLEGDFTTGATGVLTVKGQPPLPFTLTAVESGRGFTDVAEIPGVAVLTFEHTIEPTVAGSLITHAVTITGPAADELGPMVTSHTPDAMGALARLAEDATSRSAGL